VMGGMLLFAASLIADHGVQIVAASPADLRRAAMAGGRDDATLGLMMLLRDWLIGHIAGTDAGYAAGRAASSTRGARASAHSA